jgi:hypothetical protein
MNTTPLDNPDINSFYNGGGMFPGGVSRGSNMGLIRRTRRRGVGSLGSINASSSSAGPGTAVATTPTTSGTSLADVAGSAASLAATGKAVVTGVLQAEAAQNAINAQKNLTSALTPGVITMGLAVLAYWLVMKK